MTLNRREILKRASLGAVVAGLLSPSITLAQLNRRTTRIVVPYPAGGPLDLTARVLAEVLRDRWGKTIVLNKVGGAGARAMMEVRNAKPDGLTLAMGATATLAINPNLLENYPYQCDDFKPVALVSYVPNVLVMTPKRMQALGVNSACELIAYLKKHPGKLNCASGGTGSIGHIAYAILESEDLNAVHVPYSGAAAAQQALLSGECDFMFDNLASAQPGIDDGRLIPLAITTKEPCALLKTVPTMAQCGIEMDLSTWFGLFAPKDVTDARAMTLYRDIEAALKDNAVHAKLLSAVMILRLLGPQELAVFMHNEQVKYQTLFKHINVVT